MKFQPETECTNLNIQNPNIKNTLKIINLKKNLELSKQKWIALKEVVEFLLNQREANEIFSFECYSMITKTIRNEGNEVFKKTSLNTEDLI